MQQLCLQCVCLNKDLHRTQHQLLILVKVSVTLTISQQTKYSFYKVRVVLYLWWKVIGLHVVFFANALVRYFMTFLPVFRRPKKRHTNLWLFSQFSDGKKNDIQTYDFFTSFQTGSFRACWRSRKRVSLIIWRSWVQLSHGAWLFLPVFKRHTNLWLFYQFSDGIKNDIQTYDFFTSFPTT